MSANEIFEQLSTDAANDAGSKYRRVIPESPFDVRLEVTHPSGNRRLVVASNLPQEVASAKQTRGFVTTASVDEGLFRVELQDSRLRALFSALVDNFLAALVEASPSADPAIVLLDRMALWRRLFEDHAFDGLSLESQRGLFAELLFLAGTLLTTIEPVQAVRAWRAPTRTSKDFVHGRSGFEVKSRLKKGSQKVRISSEHQLDEAGFELFLVVTTLDPEAQGGESLPELVGRLRQSLQASGVAMTSFDDQLILAGYLDMHEAHYETVHYASSTMFFRVGESFPRVVPDSLPKGISHVAYDLDLATVTQHVIGPAAVRATLRTENG